MLIKKVFNLLKSFIIMILLFSFCRLIPSESIDTIEDTNTVLKANQNKTTSDTIDSIVNSSAIQTEISYDMTWNIQVCIL